ncbi:hypothetical protein KIW84_050057 [Lathyrus oleraceus]|uniref:Uncharacterized protein n=1 Tax=Pisum sativum TaxID=3888 RepID=A0A9D5AE50_PEA|nr:hypothetical protein KIW84_050057 [Pisum sativum]
MGCPMFILNKKLQLLKSKLRMWNKDIYGNIHNQIKDMSSELSGLQRLIQENDSSVDLFNEVKKAQLELEKALDMEESLDTSRFEEVIPKLLRDQMNTMMVACPSEEEIQQAVFNINKESSPGPDGFGGTFFQTYWSIV